MIPSQRFFARCAAVVGVSYIFRACICWEESSGCKALLPGFTLRIPRRGTRVPKTTPRISQNVKFFILATSRHELTFAIYIYIYIFMRTERSWHRIFISKTGVSLSTWLPRNRTGTFVVHPRGMGWYNPSTTVRRQHIVVLCYSSKLEKSLWTCVSYLQTVPTVVEMTGQTV